jgi:hypothetical protein
MQKTVEINYSEGDGLERVDFIGLVVLKRLNHGEYKQMKRGGMSVKIRGTMPDVSVDPDQIVDMGIVMAVVKEKTKLKKITFTEEQKNKNIIPIETGFDINLASMDTMPEGAYEPIKSAFLELNEIDEKKNVISPVQ